MATKAPPKELARKLPGLIAIYRNEAASLLRDVKGVTLHMSEPYDDRERDALALMAIWGHHGEGVPPLNNAG